jgi:hypothetical protein
MRMNQKMAKLLTKANVELSDERHFDDQETECDPIDVNGSVLLKSEYLRSRHIAPEDYQDRTGYECFINHVHIPCKRGKKNLLSALGHLFGLRESREEQFPERAFVIIASFSRGECTVRFHQLRHNERWLGDDLEEYRLNAILEITTREGRWAGGHGLGVLS